MGHLTTAALIVYLVILVGIAVILKAKPNDTAEDYFLANRSIGVVALTGTFFASAVNGLAVTAAPALFYSGGVLYVQMFIVVVVASSFFFFLGPRISRKSLENRLITQAEFLGHHFGSRLVQLIAAVIGLASLLPFLAAQIAGVGKILASISGGQIGFETSAVVCAGTIAIYLFIGGARAVVATDVFQGFIAFVFLAGSAWLFSHWAYGIGTAFTEVRGYMPEKLVFSSVNIWPFIDNTLSWPFAFFLWPHLFQRIMLAKRPSDIRKVAVFSLVANTFVAGCILIMAVTATAVIKGDLSNPDLLISEMIVRYWPAGGAILIVVVFALAMSTIDSIALTCGSIVVRDFKKPSDGRGKDEAKPQIFARWITLSLVLLALLMALTGPGQRTIIPLVTLSASLATLLLWPVLGTIWPALSSAAVIAAQTFGFTAICVVYLFDTPFFRFGPATAGFFAGALIFFASGLVSQVKHQ